MKNVSYLNILFPVDNPVFVLRRSSIRDEIPKKIDISSPANVFAVGILCGCNMVSFFNFAGSFGIEDGSCNEYFVKSYDNVRLNQVS